MLEISKVAAMPQVTNCCGVQESRVAGVSAADNREISEHNSQSERETCNVNSQCAETLWKGF
jgi:hypothetical protein